MAQDDHCSQTNEHDPYCEGRWRHNAWQEIPLDNPVTVEEDDEPTHIRVWVVKGEEVWQVDLDYIEGSEDTDDFIRFVVDSANEAISESS